MRKTINISSITKFVRHYDNPLYKKRQKISQIRKVTIIIKLPSLANKLTSQEGKVRQTQQASYKQDNYKDKFKQKQRTKAIWEQDNEQDKAKTSNKEKLT